MDKSYNLYRVTAWNKETGQVYVLNFGEGASPEYITATSDDSAGILVHRALPTEAVDDLAKVAIAIVRVTPSN